MIRVIFVLVAFILLTTCNNIVNSQVNNELKTSTDSNLILIKEKYPYVNVSNFALTQKNEVGENTFYSYKGEQNDTILNLSFYKIDDVITIDKYSKIYKDSLFYFQLLMNNDTIFYYKENVKTKEKEFYYGEYRYRFMTGLLKMKEMDYYMLYKDSLDKVKGTNLPELPELTKEEEVLLKKKLN